MSETLIEKMRQKLLKNPFFDIGKAFKEIDQASNGYFTAEDVSCMFVILFIDRAIPGQL